LNDIFLERKNDRRRNLKVAGLGDGKSLARRGTRGMRVLEKVMDLVRRGINEERKEQRRKGETDRMIDASVGVRRHCKEWYPRA
jgi:hypothetical protein